MISGRISEYMLLCPNSNRSLLSQQAELSEPGTKGQIKPKADWRAIDSPKKRTNEFGFFAMTVRKYLKLEIETSSFKYFRSVKQKKKSGRLVFG